MLSGRLTRRFLLGALMVIGALAFTAIFHAHLRRVLESRYVDRDDAVITLSHARNLVEYGFVGVSPSGERIEGFSAPLQFLVAAAVYAAAPFEYQTFLHWQTLIGTIALGGVFATLFLPPGGASALPHRLVFAVAAIVLGAQILASSSAFLWWHASGMENAYKTVALVALLAAFDRMLESGRIQASVGVLVFVAAITRIDAVVPVGILLGAFAVLWYARHHDARGVLFAAAGLAPWVAFMALRRIYFGQWEPNTAAAQSISVAGRLAAAVRSPLTALLDYRAWFEYVGGTLFAFQLLWLLPLAWFLRRESRAVDRVVLIAAGALACIAQYALFGPARMDPPRTVTELALYATAAAPFVLLASRAFGNRQLLIGLLVIGSSVVLTLNAPPHRLDIGWGTPTFEEAATYMERVAAAQDLPRPTIANPDLGAVSWRKHFNVVDFGRLGSAIIPRMPLPGVYVATIAQPDIIELHAPWSCFYQEMFGTAAFLQGYVRLTPPDPRDVQCPGPTGNHQAYWLRRDIMKDSPSPERRFLDRFRTTLAPDLVAGELTTCLARPEPRPCGYVGRTVFRFLPELRRAGREAAVAALLERDPRLRIEHALFTSARNPRWWADVAADPARPDAGGRP
jgi:hypothetical protein